MDAFNIAARSDAEQSKDSSTCPVENTLGPPIVPFVGNLTFHQFATILSGACGIISTIIIGTLVILHAFNYSNPVQQRQIIRIISLIPWVSLFSFLIVWQEAAGQYLAPSLDLGCSIALSSFLLFMCDLVLAHREGFDKLFGNGAKANGAMNAQSPSWMKVREPAVTSSSSTNYGKKEDLYLTKKQTADLVQCTPIHPHQHPFVDRDGNDIGYGCILQAVQQPTFCPHLAHGPGCLHNHHGHSKLHQLLQQTQGTVAKASNPSQAVYFQVGPWSQLFPIGKARTHAIAYHLFYTHPN